MLLLSLSILIATAYVPGMYETDKCKCEKDGLPPILDEEAPPDPTRCYYPLCPSGYYRCCYNCTVSTCANIGNNVTISSRGKKECLPCPTGDFCDGCDKFIQCPPTEETPPRQKISPPGTKLPEDCLTCAHGFEPSMSRDKCVPIFRDVCDESYLLRCRAGCETVATPCDEMKCMMLCAKREKDQCLSRFTDICNFFIHPPKGVSSIQISEDFSLLFEDTQTLTTTLPPAIDCDVDCNAAFSVLLWPLLLLI